MTQPSISSSKTPWIVLADFHVVELKGFCPILFQKEESSAEAEYSNFSLDLPQRSYVVLAGHEADRSPVSIPLADVTEAIANDPLANALAFCSGLTFSSVFSENFNLETSVQLKPKLCVTGSVDQQLIDLGDDLGGYKMPDPAIIDGLARSPAMKALESSVTEICHTELIDHVTEYVGNRYGEEEKSEYVKMAEFAVSKGVFGKLESAKIWLMLNLKDRVMEALKRIPLVKMPIALDMPSAFTTHPTPEGLGWKADPYVDDDGSQPRAACVVEVATVAEEIVEETEIAAEEEANHSMQHKGDNSAAVEAPEVPEAADQ